MTNIVDETKAAAKRNVDKKIVASVVVGMCVFGAITYVAVRSGMKPVVTAAKIAKGGAK